MFEYRKSRNIEERVMFYEQTRRIFIENKKSLQTKKTFIFQIKAEQLRAGMQPLCLSDSFNELNHF